MSPLLAALGFFSAILGGVSLGVYLERRQWWRAIISAATLAVAIATLMVGHHLA